MKNKKRNLYLCLTAAMLILITGMLTILFLITPKRDFSETENRTLKGKPRFSWSSFASGRYEDEFETYVTDQFPFRDMWVSVNGFLNRLTGKTELNGVFAGKDGFLLRDFTAPGDDETRELTEAAAAFAARHNEISLYMMLVPSAVTAYADKLPPFSVPGDENGYIDLWEDACAEMSVRFVDVRDAVRAVAGEEQAYYRTDHHWTTASAYAAYRQFAETAGLADNGLVYDKLLVSDTFRGTLTAMSGIRIDETDEIYVYKPVNENMNRVVTFVEEETVTPSFYDTSKLETRDQYALFFGGNHSLVKIESDTDNTRVLMILKDSYANCLIPFLVPDFKEIVIVDPRYFTDDLETLIETEGVTDLLFLYNAETLSTDTALRADLTHTE